MLAINPCAICHQLFCFSHTERALKAFTLFFLFLFFYGRRREKKERKKEKVPQCRQSKKERKKLQETEKKKKKREEKEHRREKVKMHQQALKEKNKGLPEAGPALKAPLSLLNPSRAHNSAQSLMVRYKIEWFK